MNRSVVVATVAVTQSGDWLIAGFETMADFGNGEVPAVTGLPLGEPLVEVLLLYVQSVQVVSLECWMQVVPELLRSEPVQDVHSCDMWGFGRVVHELFGSFESPNFPQVSSL